MPDHEKELFLIGLKSTRKEHDQYMERNKDEINTWKEAVGSLLHQMLEWLMPMRELSLLKVSCACDMIISEGFGEEYRLPRLKILLPKDKIITVKPYVLDLDYEIKRRILVIEGICLAFAPRKPDAVTTLATIDWSIADGFVLYDRGVPNSIAIPFTEALFFDHLNWGRLNCKQTSIGCREVI